MNYILMTGAPGSRWSGIARSIYWSTDVDHTDYTQERTYSLNGPGHTGAYWDPGMEFATDDWDGPFSGNGVRIVKSHTFAHQLEELKNTKFPIVLVYRNDYECMKWWLEAGGFKITYPDYTPYYKNNTTMFKQIQDQNKDIMKFIWNNSKQVIQVSNTYELANSLNISHNGIKEDYNYKEKDTVVYVYQPKIS